MKNPEKHNNHQRSSGENRDEWWRGPVVKGTDVFCAGSGRVREEWRSGCLEERALTGALMEQIAEPSNLAAALRQVVSNKGSAGVDGMSVQELKEWFSSHWKDLQSQLLEGRYQVAPVREVQIPKPKGGYRTLGIPTVKDRMVQQAISQVLSKRYEPIFSDHSHGFRPGRSAQSIGNKPFPPA